ncbi:MAG: site-specific DNA-methyltransferase [Prevotella sp.]|nr:site-specific DNA-methyltransferase [Prevotella sp.]
MATEKELHVRIHELEKQISFLNRQVKEVKFGLNWIDVPEAFDKESENKIPILEEVPELAISNNDGKPTHILIEGDNYHALTCLNYTHRGKVDVIYIDPPYNTGSDGFTYKDKRFLDKYPDGTKLPINHPLRHSSWLSFMSKRLKMCQDLMKDDGVIFISINEDELANLKLLCDSIFEPSNYITTFTIKVRLEDRILKGDKPIHECTEFLLMYQKSNKFKINKRVLDNSDPSDYIYEITELNDCAETITLGDKIVKVFYPGQYKIEKCEPSFVHLQKINIRGSIKTGNSSGRFHMSYLEERNNLFDVIYKVPDIGDDGRGYRYFLSRHNAKKRNGFYFQGAPTYREDTKEIPYPNFFDFEKSFNSVGTEGGVPFDGGKKPISFIQKMIEISKGHQEGLIVLDFFAGSGSTAHALMSLEKGHQVISIQYPELTYDVNNGNKVAKDNAKNVFRAGFDNISQITYKRIKNIIGGYNDGKKTYLPLGNSLKYYRTSFVGKNQPKDATDEDKIELAQKAGCLLAMAENTLYESKKTDYYQIYGNRKDIWTAIYFQEDYSQCEKFIKEVRTLSGHKNVYFFCWDDGASFASEFDMDKNVDVKSIPQPILDIYKSIGL